MAGTLNLFKIAGNAQYMTDPYLDGVGRDFWSASGDIPYPTVQNMGQPEDSTGVIYAALPAGETVDVTPTAVGVAFYYTAPEMTVYVPIIKCEATFPTNQSRTTIGVGELVDILFDPPLPTNATWTTSEGSLALYNALTNCFTAPSNAALVTVTATIPGVPPMNLNFTVIAPNRIAHTELRGLYSFPAGTIGAGMVLTPYFGPTNVSFARVEGIEVGAPPNAVTGYYSTLDPASLSHGLWGANDWFWIETNNSWQHINTTNQWDNAWWSEDFGPGPEGTFSWYIPGQWRVGTNGLAVDYVRGGAWSQSFQIFSNGDFEVSKFGWAVTRHVNGIYTTNQVGP
jgi:hypothetical protein